MAKNLGLPPGDQGWGSKSLVSIIFPNTYKNVSDGLNGISIYQINKDETESAQHFEIPAGYYSSLEQLLHTIKNVVPPLADNLAKEKFKFAIGYDSIKQKSWVRVSKEFNVEFQLDIAKLMGFDADVKIKRSTKEQRQQYSTYHPQVHGGLSAYNGEFANPPPNLNMQCQITSV